MTDERGGRKEGRKKERKEVVMAYSKHYPGICLEG
jgi:hypothetical protein